MVSEKANTGQSVPVDFRTDNFLDGDTYQQCRSDKTAAKHLAVFDFLRSHALEPRSHARHGTRLGRFGGGLEAKDPKPLHEY